MQIPFINNFIYYYRIFKLYAGQKLYILIGVIIIGGGTESIGITLFFPLLNQSRGTSSENCSLILLFYKILNFFHIKPTFNFILLLIIIIFLLKAFITLIQEAWTAYIMSTLTKDLRYKIVSNYENMKYSFYLNSNIGYLNNIITKEIEKAVAAFGHYANSIVAVIYIIIYAIASIFVNWQASILALLSGLILVYSLKKLNELSKHYSLLESEKNASLQEFLIQIISYFKYLKATDSFKRIREKLNNEINALADYVFKLGVFSGALKSLKEPLTIILLCGLLFFQVSIMEKTVAGIMVIILLFYRLVTRVFSLQYSWQKFNATIGGIETFSTALNKISKNIEKSGKKKVYHFDKKIILQDVNFRYGDKQILFGVNMIIPKNKIIAIVGESGSGKSTLVDLITGILIPQSGSIFFDDYNYNELDLRSIRRLIGYITQESVVFHDSISNNISLWECKDTNKICIDKIKNAAKVAFCEEFIKNTENGYQTIIGDRGVKLSGGQRQRLSIARELFKEPEILILDEATSSLDSISEAYIQKSIDRLKGNMTIIIIAHRLSTIKNCDYIYVMHKGRIVEEGTYNELYTMDTRFKEMCLAQKL